MTDETDWASADDALEQALERALAAILGLPPPDDGLEAADPLADVTL